MSSARTLRNSPATSTPQVDLLKVSAYDRAASLLVSLLVMVGGAVLMLFIIWLTTRAFTKPSLAVYKVEEEGSQDAVTDANEIEEPGLEELVDLAEPDIKDTLAAVTDAVSSVAASLDGIMSTRGTGGGDNRKRGNAGDVIPRWKRWEIRYSSTTLDSYAKQLEFFGIDLAAVGGGRPGVDYAFFENGSIKKRSAPADAKDERLYFIWQGGQFKQQDRALLSRAGITTTGRVICQFFPENIENRLAVLEQEKRGSRPLKDIKRTIFGVQPAGKGFDFYVINVHWRT